MRRLVVSWNWGLGIGLVTQTSLLRVFDPMEMYGVIETLQRTVAQLEGEKALDGSGGVAESQQLRGKLTVQLQEKASAEATGHPSINNSGHHHSRNQTSEWESVLVRLQQTLSSLVDDPEMLPARRQLLLASALNTVEKLKREARFWLTDKRLNVMHSEINK